MNEHVVVVLGVGYETIARTDQHTWHADLPEESGGTNVGPNPEQMLLGALGSCMAQTAKLYAVRKGWEVDRIEIRLELERFKGSDYPNYSGDAGFVHEIREVVIIEGNLDDEQRSRVREIMGKCPVRRILTNPVFIVEPVTEE